jgi:hypothetical protein
MAKARVGIKLKEAVGGKKSLNKSADLEQNKERFSAFSKKLRALIIGLKAHYASMAQLAKTRLEVRFYVRAACNFAIADRPKVQNIFLSKSSSTMISSSFFNFEYLYYVILSPGCPSCRRPIKELTPL